jgi:hypothetical protein
MPEDTTDYVHLYSAGQLTANIINDYAARDSSLTDEEKAQQGYDTEEQRAGRKVYMTNSVAYLQMIVQYDGWAADQDLTPFNEAIVTGNNLISQL